MELLKKWLDGSINWKEEKQLRNQAREDVFLSDALEGLDTLPELDHPQNIHALEQRLQDRLEKKNKTVVFPLRAIAAALLLLVSAGIWWNIQSNLNQAPIAETQILPTTTTPKSPAIESDAANISLSAPDPKTLSENKKQAKNNITSRQKPPPVQELAVVQKELPTTVLSNDPKAMPNDPIQETIIETPVAPSVAIEIPANTQEEEAVPESASSEAESVSVEEADVIAYTYEESAAASPAPAAMVEEPTLMTPPPSDEGVIRAIAEPEKSTTRTAKRKSSSASPAFPVGGMEAFEEYIKANKKYPEVAKAANIQGTVFLVFQLEADGSVKNIEVIKSLHPAYDAEAIRLLRAGPKWVSSMGIGYCEIAFGVSE